jgi:DNA polymerase
VADIAAVRPDARKTLGELQQEWSSCVRCNLGRRRIEAEGKFIFGRGTPGGVMLIGEGPGSVEEKEGVPFAGRSGRILHSVLALLGLDEYYETNLVACRSCSQQFNGQGQPLMRTNWSTRQPELVYKDEPPTPPQYNACLPRLYEEIYLVDPTVIIGLGGKVSEALMGHSITITRDRGEPVQISIPGAGYRPVLTEKRKEWLHRTPEGFRTISEQNEVRYYFMPTLHPSYVERKLKDMGHDSPFRQLVIDIKKAIRAHEVYREMVFGLLPTSNQDSDDETMHRHIQATEEPED